MLELNVPEKCADKSLAELRLRNVYGLNVLCIKNKTRDVVISPLPEQIVKSGDVLVGIAFNEKFNKKHGKED